MLGWVGLLLNTGKDRAVDLKPFIRNVPDFPKPGILFKDIAPLLASPQAFAFVIRKIAIEWAGKADAIVGLDARGFIFGGALQREMGLPFLPARKKGKLPGETVSVEYDLEYGSASLELQRDMLSAGDRVLIVDDLLATGGTAAAAASLIEKEGAAVAGFSFVIEIADLGGRAKLPSVPVQSLLVYGDSEPVSKAA